MQKTQLKCILYPAKMAIILSANISVIFELTQLLLHGIDAFPLPSTSILRPKNLNLVFIQDIKNYFIFLETTGT